MNQLQVSALIAKHTPKPKPKREESKVNDKLIEAAPKYRARLWRNLVGQFYTKWGSLVNCGLSTSSADLVGYRTITITQEMVGMEIAQFLAVESKKPGRDTTQKDHRARQIRWLGRIKAAGGVSGIARSEAELAALLK